MASWPGVESDPVAMPLVEALDLRVDSLESGDAWVGAQPGYVLTLDDLGMPFWGPGGTLSPGSLLLENGDTLTTEAGDLLVLEA